MTRQSKKANDIYVSLWIVLFLPHFAIVWHGDCDLFCMTGLLPISGASLAHTLFEKRGFRSRAGGAEAGTRTDGRNYGNRRMGDRRGTERRGTGRRDADRRAGQTASSWISTSLSAHLIGQTEPVQASPTQAVRAYGRSGHAEGRKKGGLV